MFSSPFVCVSVSRIALNYLTGFHKFREMVATGRGKKQAQLMLTNPRDAFTGQSRSPKVAHGPTKKRFDFGV